MKYSNTHGGTTPDDVWDDWFQTTRGKEVSGTDDDYEEEDEE